MHGRPNPAEESEKGIGNKSSKILQLIVGIFHVYRVKATSEWLSDCVITDNIKY